MSEYFTGLNYSLANEDTWVEHSMAPEKGRSTLVVAGSGSRVLPLLARNPDRLEIVDLSDAQLFLSELRIAAVRELEHPEFLYFMGYRGGIADGTLGADDRLRLFERLCMSDACRDFWTANRAWWEPRGFVYLGKWERHFMKLGKFLGSIARLKADPLFEAHTVEEQRRLMEKHWSETRFTAFLRVALSEFVFNRFLYKGHFAGGEGKRTAEDPAWKMVDREMTRMFRETLLRKNFFIQMIFLGEVRYEEGLPTEAHPAVFEAAKKAATEVVWTRGNFLEITRQRPFDFYSLSDTISYVTDAEARDFTRQIHSETPRGATVVIRSFMRQPHIQVDSPWSVDQRAADLAKVRDCTGVYEFLVLRKG
jgi:S-adenosylmethionine-diacylglycerol 3-amino-3-carboxypropyl transferase